MQYFLPRRSSIRPVGAASATLPASPLRTRSSMRFSSAASRSMIVTCSASLSAAPYCDPPAPSEAAVATVKPPPVPPGACLLDRRCYGPASEQTLRPLLLLAVIDVPICHNSPPERAVTEHSGYIDVVRLLNGLDWVDERLGPVLAVVTVYG